MTERLRAIVEQLDIRPDDRVFEIGCGHGGLAERWLAPGGAISSFFDPPRRA